MFFGADLVDENRVFGHFVKSSLHLVEAQYFKAGFNIFYKIKFVGRFLCCAEMLIMIRYKRM